MECPDREDAANKGLSRTKESEEKWVSAGAQAPFSSGVSQRCGVSPTRGPM